MEQRLLFNLVFTTTTIIFGCTTFIESAVHNPFIISAGSRNRNGLGLRFDSTSSSLSPTNRRGRLGHKSSANHFHFMKSRGGGSSSSIVVDDDDEEKEVKESKGVNDDVDVVEVETKTEEMKVNNHDDDDKKVVENVSTKTQTNAAQNCATTCGKKYLYRFENIHYILNYNFPITRKKQESS